MNSSSSNFNGNTEIGSSIDKRNHNEFYHRSPSEISSQPSLLHHPHAGFRSLSDESKYSERESWVASTAGENISGSHSNNIVTPYHSGYLQNPRYLPPLREDDIHGTSEHFLENQNGKKQQLYTKQRHMDSVPESPSPLPDIAPLHVRKFPTFDLSRCEDHYATDVKVAPFFEDSLEDYDAMKLEEFLQKMANNTQKPPSTKRFSRFRRTKTSSGTPTQQIGTSALTSQEDGSLLSPSRQQQQHQQEIHTTLAIQTVLSKVSGDGMFSGSVFQGQSPFPSSFPSAPTPSAPFTGSSSAFTLSPQTAASTPAGFALLSLGPEATSGFESIYVLDYIHPDMEKAAQQADFNTTLYVSPQDDKKWKQREFDMRYAALQGKIGMHVNTNSSAAIPMTTDFLGLSSGSIGESSKREINSRSSASFRFFKKDTNDGGDYHNELNNHYNNNNHTSDTKSLKSMNSKRRFWPVTNSASTSAASSKAKKKSLQCGGANEDTSNYNPTRINPNTKMKETPRTSTDTEKSKKKKVSKSKLYEEEDEEKELNKEKGYYSYYNYSTGKGGDFGQSSTDDDNNDHGRYSSDKENSSSGSGSSILIVDENNKGGKMSMEEDSCPSPTKSKKDKKLHKVVDLGDKNGKGAITTSATMTSTSGIVEPSRNFFKRLFRRGNNNPRSATIANEEEDREGDSDTEEHNATTTNSIKNNNTSKLKEKRWK